MDEELRIAHRRWQAGEPLEALLQAYTRAGQVLSDDVVRALPRWQPLMEFATRWRAEPLRPEDGLPVERVLAREEELGFRLPASLREWYRLVGSTLRDVQDYPVRLDELKLEEKKLIVHVENQGCFHWLILEADLQADDPPVHGGHDLLRPYRIADRLSELLFAKTLWEAAVGGCSTIGPLVPSARGGAFDCRDRDALTGRFPLLPVVNTGWTSSSELRGDADTLVLLDHGFVNATARTEAAWTAVLAVPGLRPM